MPPPKTQVPSGGRKQQNVRGVQQTLADRGEIVPSTAAPRRSTRISSQPPLNGRASSAAPSLPSLSRSNVAPSRGRKQEAHSPSSTSRNRKVAWSPNPGDVQVSPELRAWFDSYLDQKYPGTKKDSPGQGPNKDVHTSAPRHPGSRNIPHPTTNATPATVVSGSAGPSQVQHGSSQGFGTSQVSQIV